MPASDDQTAFAWTQPGRTHSAGTRPLVGARRQSTPAPQHDESGRKPGVAEGRADLPPDSELWDVVDAARFLKMSTSWVYKRVEAGVLPCVRVDGWSLRFVPADLRAWASTQPARRRARRAATTKR